MLTTMIICMKRGFAINFEVFKLVVETNGWLKQTHLWNSLAFSRMQEKNSICHQSTSPYNLYFDIKRENYGNNTLFRNKTGVHSIA